MSRIDDLILEFCPDGVPSFSLGDLESKGWLKLGRGKVISRSDLAAQPGDYPVYSSSAIDNGLFGQYGEFVFDDERITWSVDGGGRFFFRPAHRYSVTNVCGWLKVTNTEKVNARYLYFLLSSEWTRKTFDYTHKAHPSVIRIEYQVALPPVPVQEEIVRILDTFIKLEAELEAELEARTTQYEETRNLLMDFDVVENHPLTGLIRELCPEAVPVAPLGSLGQFFRGGSFKKDQLTSEGHPAIHYGEIYTKYRASFADVFSFVSNDVFQAQPKAIYGDLLFTVSDVTPNNVGTATTWVGDGEIALGGDILVFRHGLNPRYLSYFVKTDFFQAQKRLVVTGGTVRHISAKGLSKIRVYVPPLPVQEEIVRILDSFDSLVNDFSVGLPAEIAARRKQYESYRDKLLSFEELAV
jgi:type I restriction enzyme, S subunit